MFYQSRFGTRYRSSHLCRLSPALYPLPRRLMLADPRALRRGSATVERHERTRQVPTPFLALALQGRENRISGYLATTRHKQPCPQSRSVRIPAIHRGRPAPAMPRPTDGSMRAQGTPLTGGGGQQKNRHLDHDRPLNSLSINVQKKGGGFSQKTQQKPTGFPWWLP